MQDFQLFFGYGLKDMHKRMGINEFGADEASFLV